MLEIPNTETKTEFNINQSGNGYSQISFGNPIQSPFNQPTEQAEQTKTSNNIHTEIPENTSTEINTHINPKPQIKLNQSNQPQEQNNFFNIPKMEEFNEDSFDMESPFDFFMNEMHFPFFEHPSTSKKIKENPKKPSTQNTEQTTTNITTPTHGFSISKSYMSSMRYGDDGKPQRELYQTQSINKIGEDGHKIQEKQEKYKNTYSGVEKASYQRMFDNKGHKYIRERNRRTGKYNEKNLFKGMIKNELDYFNSSYNDYKEKIGFRDCYDLLGQMRLVPKRQQIHRGRDKFFNLLSSGLPNRRCFLLGI